MSVYKEGWYAVQEIEQSSRQVFQDAADFGVPVHEGSRIWNLLKQTADFYGVEGTRKVERYSTGATASIDIDLMHEGDVKRGKTERFRLVYVKFNRPTKLQPYSTNGTKYDGYAYVEKA